MQPWVVQSEVVAGSDDATLGCRRWVDATLGCVACALLSIAQFRIVLAEISTKRISGPSCAPVSASVERVWFCLLEASLELRVGSWRTVASGSEGAMRLYEAPGGMPGAL